MGSKQRQQLVLHPFLMAIYLVLSPLAQNIGTVGLQAIRALVTVPLIVILVTIVVRWLMQDKRKAGLLVTVGVLTLGTYGHLSEYLGSLIPISPLAETGLLLAWLGLGLGMGYLIWQRLSDPEPWHLYFNVVGLILLVFPIYNIVTYTGSTPVVSAQADQFHDQILAENGLTELSVSWVGEGTPRDIFYLVLDGYAREDVLAELYGYDNHAFIEAMEERGFVIPQAAEANYGSTVYSLASTLNMSHIDQAPELLEAQVASDPGALLSDGLGRLIGANLLADSMREAGYELITFDSGYGGAQISDPDVLARSTEISEVNTQAAFELLLMDSSIGRFLLKLRGEDFRPLGSLFDDHRVRVRYGLQHLSDYTGREGPQFVFSHVIAPHYPYVFGSNGEPRYGVEPFSLLDQEGVGEWDPGLYTDQVTYINSLVLAEVDEILAASEPDPIIVIHADHGSRSWPDPDPPPEVRQELLFPVLVAVYFPEGPVGEVIPQDLTLVNLNRLLLNQYFGTSLDYLPDTNYLLAEQGDRLRFVEACVELGSCDD